MLTLLVASLPALAPSDVVFPFDRLPTARPGRVLELAARPAELGALTAATEVRLTDVPLPGGRVVDLDLRTIPLDPADFGVRVDGEVTGFDPGDLSLWKGAVVGAADSHVVLALSSRGTYGWIDEDGGRTHVSSSPHPTFGWDRPTTRLYPDELLDPAVLAEQRCLAGTLPNVSGANQTPSSAQHVGLSSGCPELLTCPIAVETDYQLFQVWNDLGAMQNYVVALLAVISDTYVADAGVELTFPYLQFYTTSNDPWTAQDQGGGAGDVLGEFRNAWAGNVPAGAALAHFVSGAGLGGGVAYLGVLCHQDYGFGVSGNVSGGVNFPLVQGSGNWDFVVIAHELGHNFGSPHTHDYCPTPLDDCAPGSYQGACQTIEECDPGTIMSYCHLCGGIANIATGFHPVVRDVIRTGAELSCLDLAAAPDCDCDGIADAAETDCDGNGVPDDCEGSVRGLSVTYFDDQNLSVPVVTRVDPAVNYDWGDGGPAPGVGENTFSARWTGFLLPSETGVHTLTVVGDDGVRLWVDDVQVVNAWVDQGPTAYAANVSLSAGVPVSLRLEYYENGGGAVCRLRWTPPSGTETVVPSEHLVASEAPLDCNGNGVPDVCDEASGALGTSSVYGSGLAGAGGVTPSVALSCPGVGASTVLTIAGGLGGATGILVIGQSQVAVPLFGGTLLAGPPYYEILAVTLNGGGPGQGTLSLPIGIPAPSPAGTVAYAQVGLFDAFAPQGLSLSAGLAVQLPTQ